ncbi:MAG: nitroreductase family deazaflavin-dependent oxidoreductase [Actinobacteria bacterium]|uniref:Unannotated protein n=1 Tax=freshwater metagenome TaxID=449393 RepID=A0A6J7P284_9ZZZZ|nr:nitroreductase family deazaflavin-dependent oxidoreductase [Actinomycetota bacterium]MSW76407.1 nitroreductase family deazaflavin-dependent oxidoreductase [Actinomycetota bacterium]MSX94631.1 nitroreductase family deazaflavin-dependent oxidoreductase [Actinomycetota bacterium]MSZ82295.1 nitroreductase family deazaflavin-dependent oxidoreductase [Actinomycetota bacterium]MTB16526.1 nitroreductase family deazaflavin-dependent oxidoreductase [Actinomycetota bacterium]
MTIEGEYIPGKVGFTRRQVEAYEASGGTAANVVEGRDVGVVIVTMRGAKSGAVRKIALIRVEHEGEYALVASMGGAPTDPQWAGNLRAHPDEVAVQDGPAPHHVVVREVDGDERAQWWDRSVAVYPEYAEYQTKTDRLIPVFVTKRV